MKEFLFYFNDQQNYRNGCVDHWTDLMIYRFIIFEIIVSWILLEITPAHTANLIFFKIDPALATDLTLLKITFAHETDLIPFKNK